MNESSRDMIAFRLHAADDVAVLKRAIPADTTLRVSGAELSALRDIPAGHKTAVHVIAKEAPVRKYGQIIGFATEPIAPGNHVHTHNLVVREFDREYAFCADARMVRFHPPEERRTFQGYSRPDGRAGTRNTIAIIPTVNCAASAARAIAAQSSNTPLYQRMADDMDLDSGSILDGKETVEEVGLRILEELIAVAGGKRTKSEAQGIGDEEFAPWILGPTL